MVEILRFGGTGHGRGKQHACSEWTGEQQLISRPQPPFLPGVSGTFAIHAQAHLQPQRQRGGSLRASLQGVPANQPGPLWLEGGTQSRQGLTEQLLLQRRCCLGQGDHGHG